MAPKRFWIYVTMMMACLLPSSLVIAQPKSVGVSFSYTGISLSYEMNSHKSNSFIDLELKAENSEFYAGRSKFPGISASASLNYYLKQWCSDDGTSVNLFAGPGLIAGYCPDYKTLSGVIFGLKGKLGTECIFNRNVLVSVAIAPILGTHLLLKDDAVQMKYYRNGLQYALIPEIGIKYRF